MNKKSIKILRKGLVAAAVVAVGLYFIPIITLLYLLGGIIDVLRNDQRNAGLFSRYFLGNGLFTWLLSPFNLLIDLVSYRNRGVWQLDQFPEEYRREVEEVLAVFQERRDEIIADIDAKFESGRRGMYVYQWYGKQHIDNVPAFTRRYKYIRTIAVSVFSGRESTSLHFGPLRLTLRVLYNLMPVKTDQVFIECGDIKHYWHENPLFIFDDTLLHRSVNEYDGRRYCVFMDVIRPSPVPRLLSALLRFVSLLVDGVKAVFYKNWIMIGAKPRGDAPAG
ncbi:aspartyl/asparaginyl beta-hydroxylase domain-containing protein [Chelativorans salis]|uniref:Aspartyl/asparaginyl beta-hydroxylase domain-containing protein n=1 Tax=Chelativorans salis TaxID=2978478 RepID=A0ABT2LKJ3_9HYPH|nr:aspartyl/asparaginyl beta-hydroxylase domain-containing protein [Chelativorans sp. EGI FJ00035]MCT7375127.1 aspartyl/asparaginyl beta-hydroxylase domain-containing protein [Chelativorans sp. EGI FJ00035]